MPFVVPPTTRGKTPQKPLYHVILTRIADKIAGTGLENFRIEWDLRAEAEQTLTFTPSARGNNNNNNNQNQSQTTTAVNIPMDNNNNNSAELKDTICCLSPPDDSSEEDRIVINKYGAHFVYIPTLGRYIARADRKTVRASTISGRLCFALQCLILLVGIWALTMRSVDCLGPAVSDHNQPLMNQNPNLQQKPSTTSAASGSGGDHRPVNVFYPGWHHLTNDRSGLYVFIFFLFAIGGSIFQFFLLFSGDRSLGNPGYISIEGDDQVAFELSGEYQNCVVDCSIPHELRKACKTCGGPQPLRCRHCKSCGRCVPRCDHHCFWLGHCVGSYDYASFVLLISTMALMASFGLDFLFGSWVNVWDNSCGVPGNPNAGYFTRQWHANAFTFFFILLVLFATVALWLLVASHIALTMSDMTTYEFARPGKNQHMRYYPAVPSLAIPFWTAVWTWIMTKKNGGSSNSAGSKPQKQSFLNSPFSENGVQNVINLWWHYGTRSMFSKFGVGSKWHISALPRVRNGSIDGVNFFVSSGVNSSNSNNNSNGNNTSQHDVSSSSSTSTRRNVIVSPSSSAVGNDSGSRRDD